MITAIVYTSKAGHTAAYAKLLGETINLPAYSMKEAEKRVLPGMQVIYMGWIMGNMVKGYQVASKRYKVQAVCAVGMGMTGSKVEDVRYATSIPGDMPLFTLQGGYDKSKVHGFYKLIMHIVSKNAAKDLAEKTKRTREEEVLMEMLTNGGDRVHVDNLKAVLKWYQKKGI